MPGQSPDKTVQKGARAPIPGGGTQKPKGVARPTAQGAKRPKGVEVIQERWDFYKAEAERWHSEVKWWRWVAAGLFVLLPITFLVAHESPKVIAIDGEGRVVHVPEINDKGEMSDSAIRRFCGNAINQIGTYGFANYGRDMEAQRPLFTDAAWRSINESRVKQKMEEAVTSNFLNYVTQVNGPCEIMNQGVKNGRYWWLVRADADRRISAGKIYKDEKLKIEMEIVRVGYTESRELVAINRWKE